LPGLGAGVTPHLYRPDVADHVQYVSDIDCIQGCRDLVRYESILAGASSGGVIAAIRKMVGCIPEGAVCAAILPDRGERYLDTVYDDEWVRRELSYDPVPASQGG
jgi:cysteine synthase A